MKVVEFIMYIAYYSDKRKNLLFKGDESIFYKRSSGSLNFAT